MSAEVWSLLLAAGAVQGLILGIALLRIPAPAPAPKILAALVGSLALILCEESLDISGWGKRVPHTVAATVSFELLIGPLALLYARALVRPRRPQPRAMLHFLPFLLSTLYLLPFYAQTGDAKLRALNEDPDGIFLRLVSLKAAHLFAYLIWTLGSLSRDLPSVAARPHLAGVLVWYRRAVTTACCLGVASFALYLLGRSGVDLAVDSDRLSGLVLTVWIYAIAFVSIARSSLHRSAVDESGPAGESKVAKYSTSPLSAARRKQLGRQLVAYLEREEPYLDGEIRLGTLAGRLEVPAHHLSEVLNQELGTSFNELMNRYRVEAAKASLGRPESHGRTILDLAFASGFNSKASFHRAFKKHTGATPSQYRRHLPRSDDS